MTSARRFPICAIFIMPLLVLQYGVLAFGRAIQLWAAGRLKQKDDSSSRTIETAGRLKQQKE
jgi:sensor domain CHASE-containing protein